MTYSNAKKLAAKYNRLNKPEGQTWRTHKLGNTWEIITNDYYADGDGYIYCRYV